MEGLLAKELRPKGLLVQGTPEGTPGIASRIADARVFARDSLGVYPIVQVLEDRDVNQRPGLGIITKRSKNDKKGRA